jgi:hypothetical protein
LTKPTLQREFRLVYDNPTTYRDLKVFFQFFPGGNEDTASNNLFISKIFLFLLFYSISDIFIIYFEKTNYMSKTSIENIVENVSLFIGLVIQLQQLQTSKFQVHESEVLISID